MKLLIQKLLAVFAKQILRKYHPTIVAVTGSVGKTSTRNAIAAVLSQKFSVRSPEENYNNEWGVPLTIIGCKSPGKSILGWLKVFFKAVATCYMLHATRYPRILVLEFGLDHPGDIKQLCQIAQPDISVLTAITPVHAEFFSSIEDLAKEKGEIIRGLKSGGVALLNADDQLVMEQRSNDLTITYGFSSVADVRAENYQTETRMDGCAIRFDLNLDGEHAPVVLPNLLGRGQVYAALAAAAVGKQLGMTIDEIVAGLATLQPQAGRMRPLAGIKGTLLLDDTYNAAPASMAAALEVLRDFSPVGSGRRIAVLGKMAELGQYSEAEHRLLGLRAAEVADILVCVNEESCDTRRGAIEAGMDESRIEFFSASTEAGRWLDFNVQTGDIVLLKGSQSSRMEKAVKDLLADPLQSEKLLVRQYGAWLEA